MWLNNEAGYQKISLISDALKGGAVNVYHFNNNHDTTIELNKYQSYWKADLSRIESNLWLN